MRNGRKGFGMAKMGWSVVDKQGNNEAEKSENNQIKYKRALAPARARAFLLTYAKTCHVDNFVLNLAKSLSSRSPPQFPCHFSPCIMYLQEPALL